MAATPRNLFHSSTAAGNADLAFLNPCFLGSSGENSEIFERVLLDLVRDHIYWRRNFHPEDTPPIPMLAVHQPEYIEFMDRMRTELNSLTAALKRSVPFFNPRYLGHMVSDTLLPGLLAQLVTTLYNPNNVSPEAAPVTLELELKVGEQLARMLGFATDPTQTPCAWGHLTSGGTLANFESLVNLRALRSYPLALKAALLATGRSLPLTIADGQLLTDLDDWALFNLLLDDVMALPTRVAAVLQQSADVSESRAFSRALADRRIEQTGLVEFFRRHPECGAPRILAPVTAHYSWRKAAKVLGFGRAQLLPVAVDSHMRMSVVALERQLETCLKEKTPVLAVVAVLGTTEFGTLDPLQQIVDLRERFRKQGLEFALHVDAAWGGYLASIFRNSDGSLVSHAAARKGFHYFPSSTVYESFGALKFADSVTVDPHKLGYLPYGIGGIVWRDSRVRDFVGEKAPYVFDERDAKHSGAYSLQLGQYILEGSKPGAAAAAAWVAHRVLPLDREHLGRLQRHTIHACEYLYDQLPQLAQRLKGRARIVVPFEPDTNLICMAINPEGNRDLAAMNRFGERIYSHLDTGPGRAATSREFFSSHTRVERNMLGAEDLSRVLTELGIDPDTFMASVENPEIQADNLFLLRNTLMNPWLLENDGDRNPLDRYLEYLESLINAELDSGQWRRSKTAK
ncbi:MAG TPA: pyridoxal-dependent decarboxylase [Gammaproteobacteria bacterium]|nr:pyridoxal-dependent decarboxylase [Gammaproteobacteria bacterium]